MNARFAMPLPVLLALRIRCVSATRAATVVGNKVARLASLIGGVVQ